jgi:hypothetical protein
MIYQRPTTGLIKYTFVKGKIETPGFEFSLTKRIADIFH